MKTLYVTDLDGTILNDNEKLSEFTVKVINELIDQGIYFTYATVRSILSASIVTDPLKINIPVITKNGIFIENAHTKEQIYSLKFLDEEKQLIIETMNKFSIYPIVYGHINGIEKRSWIKQKENDGIKREIETWVVNKDPRIRPVDTKDELYFGDIFHFNCFGGKHELLDVYNHIQKTEIFSCMLRKDYYRDDYFCEIMPKKANKGNALLVLKEKMHFDKIISFGDGLIDIPMFKVSDESFAVENAEEELKKIATGIISSNNNDGVANWLKENYKK